MGGDLVGVAVTTTLDVYRGASPGRSYLLVIEDGSSSIHRLPSPGVVSIGRGPDVELRVNHASVSRLHARIVIDGGEARLCDTDSHNGTRVNGVRLEGVHVLMTGDVIAVGEVLLVVHAEPERERSRCILDEVSWRRRLAEEIERAFEFHRPLAVLALANAPPHVERALRAIDIVGQLDDGLVAVALPEADPTTAHKLAAVVLEASRDARSGVRIGIARCPVDAADADNLVVAARAATDAAPIGGLATAADAVRRIALGEREALVCHPAMVRVFELIERLARADIPVLVLGETGVGKENAAYAVHHFSARRNNRFVALNCAALPEALVEAELFGHERGAFTGAVGARAGVFEAASGGTLFLDEIGELALPVQAKLLRVLETHRITRLGDTKEREIDVRIVAATHRALDLEVRAQRFREDLYFRLGLARVHLLPLRDRRCEVPVLFRELLAQAATRARRKAPEPSPEVLEQLLRHDWPGNVRELKSVADFILATVEGDRIEPGDLPAALTGRPAPSRAPSNHATSAPREVDHDSSMRPLAAELEEIERHRMIEALTRTRGVKTRAAAMLGMPIRTFNMKIRKYALQYSAPSGSRTASRGYP